MPLGGATPVRSRLELLELFTMVNRVTDRAGRCCPQRVITVPRSAAQILVVAGAQSPLIPYFCTSRLFRSSVFLIRVSDRPKPSRSSPCRPSTSARLKTSCSPTTVRRQGGMIRDRVRIALVVAAGLNVTVGRLRHRPDLRFARYSPVLPGARLPALAIAVALRQPGASGLVRTGRQALAGVVAITAVAVQARDG